MPIEIRELVIKTSINDGEAGQNKTSGTQGKNGANDQDAIIAACVEQVLAILKEKSER
ncbi:hypothetical protein NIES37_50060 [Tolypothrix tenuis PCC 7101]|uniref:Uncharacterized protein n=1 Tax=Tolypothrix tenuis PCC 7101 TaxID=231146 RepID=A0A1Z4N5K8_9CYAN|nr:hypothetical protein [Aulosira sp. FACHB-113]BAZ01008.1 hypothetical protein NIES37_50060 [Tolypothrix tenuis PCC 7101]BAZ75069.1 hypothetical protein NIES50_36490 [Aulosira laxa NIES-50]